MESFVTFLFCGEQPPFHISSLLLLSLKIVPFSYTDHDGKKIPPAFQYLESLAPHVL